MLISNGDKFNIHNNKYSSHKPNPEYAGYRSSKYLWVLDKEELKINLDETTFPEVKRYRKVTYINLTGGGRAYAAGEVWFIDNDTVRINAGVICYLFLKRDTVISKPSSFEGIK